MATPKKKRTRPKYNWSKIRAMWESGDSSFAIAAKRNMPSHVAINKHVKAEEWTRNLNEVIQKKVTEKVTGIVTESDSKERADLIDKESTKRAAIELRHRDEPGHVRSLLYKGMKAQKDAVKVAEKRLAQEDLKAAKLSMEIMKGIQEMERKSYRLDTPSDNGGSNTQGGDLSDDKADALMAVLSR